MSGGPKEKLYTTAPEETTEAESEREVFLKGGKKLVVSEQGGDQLVEIRSESGMLEVRIKLTEQGPVLQMESVRMQLKAAEAVEIESNRVEIKASEQVAIEGGKVAVTAEEDATVDAKGEVRVVGKTIWLN
jgi:phage gp45-like